MSLPGVLLDDAYAPLTTAIGFLRAPLEEVVDALAEWRRAIHGSVNVEPLAEALPSALSRLAPLTGGVRPRELVMATRDGEWTALFDCGVSGGDPISSVGYLAQHMMVSGVAILSIPDSDSGIRDEARQLEIFGPLATGFLNSVRAISVVRDGARWRFDQTGTQQDFEDTAAYDRRRIADRFTTEMLTDYAFAMGIEPFAAEFYADRGALVTNHAVPPSAGLVLALKDARRRLGLD